MFEAHTKPAGANAATPSVAAAAPGAAAAAKADSGAGEKLYKQSCNACHAAGVAGAPKTGDKVAWAPRITLGVDALVSSVVKGKGAMPPRGASGNATDAEIRAAVEYLVAQAK
jgi:cytochrome c5